MRTSLERLRQRHKSGEGGFTLIELLIVIVILAILAAIVVFAVQNLTKQSAAAACQSDYKTVESAAETFKAQVGDYPGGTLDTATLVGTALATPAGMVTGSQVLPLMEQWKGSGTTVGPWLKDFPVNPSHYQIALTSAGVIQVYGADGAATIPATGATATSADCASVG